MKTNFTVLAVFMILVSCQYGFAFTTSDDEVNSWVGTPAAGFIENKGQLCDVNNIPAPYLLFKLQDRNMDVYITERGLSDVMGKEVQTLVNERLGAGTYEASFDGFTLNSGVYFYKMQTADFTDTKRMLLIK